MTMSESPHLFNGWVSILWFFAGIFSVQVWQWVKCKYRDHIDPAGAPHRARTLKWFYVSIAVVFAMSITIGIQNQQTYAFTMQLAKDTRACQVEFNTALVRNREINGEDRKLDQRWQTATLSRVRQLIALQDRYGNSPEYFSEKDAVDNDYSWAISRIEDERAGLERQRKLNPYPDPTCGR